MARLLSVTAMLAGAAGCSGCSSESLVDDVFTADEWAKIGTLSPLPDVPKDTTNKFADDPKAATFGQRLFFEKGYSGPIIVGSDTPDGGPNSGANGKAGETGKIACASCHDPANTFVDHRSTPNNTALGTQWMIRNASTTINSSYYTWLENDGLRDSQWADGLTDPEDPTSMNGSRLRVAHLLFDKYRADYDALFTDAKLPASLDPKAADAARFPAEASPSHANGEWAKMTPADQATASRIYANFGKAVQAYVRKLVSKNAPFDRYVAGDKTAIGDSAKRGLKLFVGKANCVACHNTPVFSDNKFHTTGMAVTGAHAVTMETGRYDAMINLAGCEFRSDSVYSDDVAEGKKRLADVTDKPDEKLKGLWRTKGLREIAQTAPYTHAGQFATLPDVIAFYNKGGDDKGFVGTKDPLMKPLNLTDAEISDLVAFLGTLSGDPIPADLSKNTAAP